MFIFAVKYLIRVPEIKVKGINLKAVNAFSFALPYNAQDIEFLSIVAMNIKNMENIK